MAPFFDIHLKNISQVVEGRAAHAEQALLLDRCGFGVALSHDHATQSRSIFTRNFLPGSLALVHSKIYLAVRVARLQKYSPAIFRHAHVSKLSPAIGFA